MSIRAHTIGLPPGICRNRINSHLMENVQMTCLIYQGMLLRRKQWESSSRKF
uniref:Uncharacterized protein n=1 Tax=Setaria viridis TaxID=4556 RepID=A0A4U6TDN9_SETVI|nr:hypothetical protein SEVIR_9G577350v2 [Setaria viridis]